MIVNLPVRVVFPRRAGVEVTLPNSTNVDVMYEDIEERYLLDTLVTLPDGGTEIDIASALGDLARARAYCAEQYDLSGCTDEAANALVSDIEHVRQLLLVLARAGSPE